MSNIIPFRRRRPKQPKRARARRRFSLLGPWLPVAALVAAAATTGYFSLEPRPQGAHASAVTFQLCNQGQRRNCIVDGDTIWYQGVKIRLADLDAPEVSEPKCASEKALGDRATLRLLELMNGGPFTVIRVGDRDEDRYGRKLRIIQRDGRSISEALIAEGLARRWDGRRRSWCR